MKTLISSSPAERKSVLLMSIILGISIYITSFIVFLLLSEREFSWQIMLKLASVSCMEILIFGYILDEILWQIKGKEIIEYDSSYLYIIRKGVFFNKSRKLSWNDILKVNFRKINPIWEFITYITFTGVSQDNLTIFLKNRKRIHCGYNLTATQCKKVIEIINREINNFSM